MSKRDEQTCNHCGGPMDDPVALKFCTTGTEYVCDLCFIHAALPVDCLQCFEEARTA